MGKNIELSWEEIGNLTDAQVAMSGWNKNIPAVGDTKDITIRLKDEDITISMEIIGVNHDVLLNDNKAHYSFLCKEVYIKRKMNVKDTNENGWEKSNLRKWLNKTLYNALPDDLTGVIKTVKKVSDSGNLGYERITNDEIWIPSIHEVCKKDSKFIIGHQGTLYEGFENKKDITKRYYKTGVLCAWMLRSSFACNDSGFWVVSEARDDIGSYASSENGVVFGFCI